LPRAVHWLWRICTTGCWHRWPEQQDAHEDPVEMNDWEKCREADLRARGQRVNKFLYSPVNWKQQRRRITVIQSPLSLGVVVLVGILMLLCGSMEQEGRGRLLPWSWWSQVELWRTLEKTFFLWTGITWKHHDSNIAVLLIHQLILLLVYYVNELMICSSFCLDWILFLFLWFCQWDQSFPSGMCLLVIQYVFMFRVYNICFTWLANGKCRMNHGALSQEAVQLSGTWKTCWYTHIMKFVFMHLLMASGMRKGLRSTLYLLLFSAFFILPYNYTC
jgi:hypothetical protein